MVKSSISVKQKKRGRPATGITPFIGIRLPKTILDALDVMVKEGKAKSRTDAIKLALTDYLKRKGTL